MHVSEIHQDIVELNSKIKNADETMDYIQSAFVDDDDSIQCDEYLETINNKSSFKKVKINRATLNEKNYLNFTYKCKLLVLIRAML